MYKTNRPEEGGPANEETTPIASPHFDPSKQSGHSQFACEADFGQWIDGQLDHLEAMYADCVTRDSLRGYFQR